MDILHNLIMMFFVTSMTSISMFAALKIKIIKDIFDNGYKISYNNQENNQGEYEEKKDNYIDLLLPIYNIIFVIKTSLDYIKNKDIIIDDSISDNLIKEMNELEKEVYEFNPTLSNGMFISKNNEEIKKITISNQLGLSEMLYTSYNGKNKILKATGIFEDLSYAEKSRYIESKYESNNELEDDSTEVVEKILNVYNDKKYETLSTSLKRDALIAAFRELDAQRNNEEVNNEVKRVRKK